MIGDLVESDLPQWLCFLKLWNITQICTAPAITREDVLFLRLLISEHHTLFKEVYPEASFIPKLHYLVHVPDDILRYGICCYITIKLLYLIDANFSPIMYL